MKSILLLGLALFASLTSTASAQGQRQLGRMWTFENPPLAYLETEYGFKPDPQWLNSLRLGSLRLGGRDVMSGSASFVSPDGLILTSTRCVRQAMRRGAADRARSPHRYTKAGFVAAEPDDEIRLKWRRDEWLTAAQLIKITNITDEVHEGIAPADSEMQSKKKRDANKQAILDAARNGEPKLVPQIVSLHQGAVVKLYQYKVYRDLRLVVVPRLHTAHFGGDADSFAFPRHCVDFAFLRAYENGKPADTSAHYFPWKTGGAKQDELVFVSGHFGTTKRSATLAQLLFERDIRIPMQIELLANRLRILTGARAPFGPGGPTWDMGWVRMLTLDLQIAVKAARGRLRRLQDAQWIARKTAAENAFKARVMADQNLRKQYGDVWNRMEGVMKQRRRHEARAQFHVPNHFLLHAIVAIVRVCDPSTSDEQREHARQTVESWAGVTSPVPAWPGSAFVFEQWDRAPSWLPENDPYFTKVLGGKSIDVLKTALTTDTPSWLGHPAQRDALVKAGWAAIQKSEDPVVIAARELAVLIRENDKLGEALDAKEEALRLDIGRALLACYGADVSPDGTSTLRFTDGVVKGLASGGTGAPDRTAPHRTTFYGLYARNVEHDNAYPFNLPQIWLDRKDEIDMTKPINFVSTNDIAGSNLVFNPNQYGGHRWWNSGGNSGSVVVNTALEVVGLILDGNIESLGNDVAFEDDVPRAVSTHVDGIMETLVKIYDARRVVAELTGR